MFNLLVWLSPEISFHWDWAFLFLEYYEGILEFMVLHALVGSLIEQSINHFHGLVKRKRFWQEAVY